MWAPLPALLADERWSPFMKKGCVDFKATLGTPQGGTFYIKGALQLVLNVRVALNR
jgi:hypothetical protein